MRAARAAQCVRSLGAGSAHRQGPQAEARLVEVGKTVSALLEGGAVRPHISKVISLEDVCEALVSILERRTVGKIVMANRA